MFTELSWTAGLSSPEILTSVEYEKQSMSCVCSQLDEREKVLNLGRVCVCVCMSLCVTVCMGGGCRYRRNSNYRLSASSMLTCNSHSWTLLLRCSANTGQNIYLARLDSGTHQVLSKYLQSPVCISILSL